MARHGHGEVLGQSLLELEPAAASAGAVQEEQGRTDAVLQEMDRRAAHGQLAPGGGHQPMKRPPLGDRYWPVMNDDSSQARNSAVAAISRASPARPIGVRPTASLRPRSDMLAVIGVSM